VISESDEEEKEEEEEGSEVIYIETEYEVVVEK